MGTISRIIEDAPVTPEIDATFNKIKTALKAPFTPHFFRLWAASPESLKGIWPVMNHILTRGRVGRRLKEMIFVAISSLKSCHYCEVAHPCVLFEYWRNTRANKAFDWTSYH